MENQERSFLEVLWDFCESGDAHTLVRGDSAVLPESCTSMSKVVVVVFFFHHDKAAYKKTMPWLNKQGVKALKYDIDGIETLRKLKYGIRKTMPIKGGLTIGTVEQFLAAVGKARGKDKQRHHGNRWQH